MGGLRLTVGTGDRARLDGIETVDAALVGRRTPEARELGIRTRPTVGQMRVTALRVGLPDFDHRVVDRHPIAVEHTALDADLGAGRIGGHAIGAGRLFPVVNVLALFGPPLATAVRGEPVRKERADGLGGGYF